MATASLPPLSLDDIVTKLKSEISNIWLHGKANRLALGRKLIELRAVYGKRGEGTFLKILAELGIPRSTAYDYIHVAEEEEGSYGIRNSAPEFVPSNPDLQAEAPEVEDDGSREKHAKRLSFSYTIPLAEKLEHWLADLAERKKKPRAAVLLELVKREWERRHENTDSTVQ